MTTYYVLITEWKKCLLPSQRFSSTKFLTVPMQKLFHFTVLPKVCPYISVSHLPGSTTGIKPEKPNTVGIQEKLF